MDMFSGYELIVYLGEGSHAGGAKADNKQSCCAQAHDGFYDGGVAEGVDKSG